MQTIRPKYKNATKLLKKYTNERSKKKFDIKWKIKTIVEISKLGLVTCKLCLIEAMTTFISYLII